MRAENGQHEEQGMAMGADGQHPAFPCAFYNPAARPRFHERPATGAAGMTQATAPRLMQAPMTG